MPKGKGAAKSVAERTGRAGPRRRDPFPHRKRGAGLAASIEGPPGGEDRLGPWGSGAVLAVLGLLPFLLGRLDVAGQTTHRTHFLIHALLSFAFGAFLVRTARRKNVPRDEGEKGSQGSKAGDVKKAQGLGGPLAALVLLSALSCLPSVNRYVSVVATLRLLDAALLAWLVMQMGPRTRLYVVWLMPILAGAMIAAAGVREYLESVFWQPGPGHRIFTTFFNNNCLAAWLLVVLPWAAGLIGTLDARHPAVAALAARKVSHPGGKLRILALLIGALLTVALVLTQSKGGFLGFLGAAIAFVGGLKLAGWGTFNRRWILGALLGGMLLGGLVALSPLGQRFVHTFTTEQHSLRHRLLTWQGTWQMARTHPFLGTGPGTFEYAYPQFARGSFTAQAHNTYLQIAAETGFAALGAFLWLLFAVGQECVRAARTRDDPLRALAGVSGLSALVGLALHNLVDYSWSVPAVRLTWLALAGLVFATRTSPTPPNLRSPFSVLHSPFSVLRSPFSVGIWGLLMILLSVPLLRAAGAEYWTVTGRRLWQQGGVASSVRALEKAILWAPGNGDTYRELAQYLFSRSRGSSRYSDYRRALALLEQQAIPRQPTLARNYYLLARYHALQGEPQEALRWYTQAAQYDPLNPQIWLRLGQTYERQGQLPQAEAAYLRLVDIWEGPVGQTNPTPEYRDDSPYGEALVALGRLAWERGDLPAARKRLQRGRDVLVQFLQQQAAAERWWKQARSPEERQQVRDLFHFDPQERERLQNLLEEAEALMKRISSG